MDIRTKERRDRTKEFEDTHTALKSLFRTYIRQQIEKVFYA